MLNLKYFYLLIGCFFITSFIYGQDKLPFSVYEKGKTHSGIDSKIQTSLGFGTSYGGYGAKINYFIYPDSKIGIQLGAGYYFDDFMINGALKLFLWKNLYADFKYGTYSRRFELSYDSNYDVAEIAKILVGPGMVLGYELFPFKNLGLNAGAGFNYDLKYEQGISYAYDIGILYKF